MRSAKSRGANAPSHGERPLLHVRAKWASEFREPEKYPHYDAARITDRSPASLSEPRPAPVSIEPPAPRPLAPRRVNPENLSAAHRELYGKTLFEKDLARLAAKAKATCEPPPAPSAPLGRPPKCWFRAEAERERRLAEAQANMDRIMRESSEVEFRPTIDDISGAPSDHVPVLSSGSDEDMEEMLARAAELKAERFAPDRPTRASELKRASGRRRCENHALNERQERMNGEMRRETLRQQTKRLKKVVEKLNPDVVLSRRVQMQKDIIIDATKTWTEWLELTEQTNKTRGTMLERLFLAHESMANLQVQLPNDV